MARVWAGPVVLGVLILAGLVGALLIEGVAADIAGGIGLGVPIACVVWFLSRARRRQAASLANSQ